MRKLASTSSITASKATRVTDPRFQRIPTDGPERVRPFSFTRGGGEGSLRCVKRSLFRKFLFLLLIGSALFAAAVWLLPYEWGADPGARFKISAVQVKRDRTYYWLTAHLKKSGDGEHDLRKPVTLVLGDGREMEPADTTFSGEMGPGTTEIWFKFWLDENDLKGPLVLHLNDGSLKVKSSADLPRIGSGGMRTFSNHRW